jgi:hypothetical protein
MKSLALLLLLLVPGSHDVHSAHVRAQLEGTTLDLRIRAFADDLAAGVAAFHRRPPPPDSSVDARELARYVSAQVGITGADGRQVPLVACGAVRQGAVYDLCFRGGPLPGGALRVRMALLMDLHPDQVNVMEVRRGAWRRTLLFSRDDPEGTIPAR